MSIIQNVSQYIPNSKNTQSNSTTYVFKTLSRIRQTFSEMINLVTNTHTTRLRQVAAQLANLRESTRLEFGAVALGSPIRWLILWFACYTMGQCCISLSNARWARSWRIRGSVVAETLCRRGL